jgi:hypothetical protein
MFRIAAGRERVVLQRRSPVDFERNSGLSGRLPLEKERRTKDDGRYIIFYTFEDEDDEPGEEKEGE